MSWERKEYAPEIKKHTPQEIADFFDANVYAVAGSDPGVMVRPVDGCESFFIPENRVFLPEISNKFAVPKDHADIV